MGHFSLLDPDPDSESESTDLIESGSGSETPAIRNLYSMKIYNCLLIPQEIDHSGSGRRRPQEVHCRPEEPLCGLNHPPLPPPHPLSLCFRHVKNTNLYITDV